MSAETIRTAWTAEAAKTGLVTAVVADIADWLLSGGGGRKRVTSFISGLRR